MSLPETHRLILNVAAAQQELETVAILMSSIGALCEAAEVHEIETVWAGYGIGRDVRCQCGVHTGHRWNHDDHVLDAARALREDACE